MKITVLSDADSWIVPYVFDWRDDLEGRHEVEVTHTPQGCSGGDFLFLLSCGTIVGRTIRDRYRMCLVVHESQLPQGRGWSPLTWQIIEGKNRIPITLLEASDKVDSGRVFLTDEMVFEGHELIDELREQQGRLTVRLCQEFIDRYPAILSEAKEQQGEATYYPRRRPADSQLDPDKSLREQFNLLRTVDNERYPAFFEINGHRYILKICREQR